MDKLTWSVSRQLEISHEAEVIVVGGGPGGIGAAAGAARAGAKTLLIERYGFLGGMASAGEVQPFMPNHLGGNLLDTGVYTDWLKAMTVYQPNLEESGQPADLMKEGKAARRISKDAAMLAAEDVVLASGAKILYHHWLADVLVEDGTITGLVLLSKSGFTLARAKVYIDSTGDGDLAARAGAPFEMGGESGYCQPMTLCFKLSHVDRSRMPDGPTLNRLYREAQQDGRIECTRENVLWFSWFDADVVHFNTTRVIKHDGTSGRELSDAEIIARKQMRQFVAWLRKSVAGYEQAQVHSMAHHIGVRETRRVKGQAYITRQDFISRKKFPDAVVRCNYGIDIHNPLGSGTERLHIGTDDYYEIPYGCLVPGKPRNLLLGSRCISSDHAMHSSFRVMPPVVSIGQAAGVAAAMSVQKQKFPPELDGTEIRARLKSLGANL